MAFLNHKFNQIFPESAHFRPFYHYKIPKGLKRYTANRLNIVLQHKIVIDKIEYRNFVKFNRSEIFKFLLFHEVLID